MGLTQGVPDIGMVIGGREVYLGLAKECAESRWSMNQFRDVVMDRFSQ